MQNLTWLRPMADYCLKRSSSSWNLANYNISIVGVVIGVADEAARIEGESISKSWHGVKTYKVDAGVEETPAELLDTTPRWINILTYWFDDLFKPHTLLGAPALNCRNYI